MAIIDPSLIRAIAERFSAETAKPKTTIHRQGDVLFIRRSSPDNVTLHSQGVVERTVAAYGEATGHSHAIMGPVEIFATEKFQHPFTEVTAILARGVRAFVNVLEGEATVVHEEHGPITLDKGLWEVRRQREHSLEDGFRYVAD